MSKLFIDNEDFSAAVKDLNFSCGICCSNNTYINFEYIDGNGGSMTFECYDCKAFLLPTHYKEWTKSA